MVDGQLRRCFQAKDCTASPQIDLAELGSEEAEALALLLPLLGCGEEAAVMAFDGLAGVLAYSPAALTLAHIARDEEGHDRVISQLRRALPTSPCEAEMMRRSRRFHISLGVGGPALHLARIAALDAATCTILSRLLQTGGVLAAIPDIARALSGIRADEARHVAVSRRLALDLGDPHVLRDVASSARHALADTMGLAADGFERLGVDPRQLDRDIRRLPDGLLQA